MKSKRTSLTLRDLARRVAELFPPHIAESWDNVGLQIGDPGARVRRVMSCLEVTAPTIAEARRRRADTLLAHHPLIFRPIKSLLESSPAEKLAIEMVRAGLNLIVAHTNMDSAPWGTNQVLAAACGLIPTAPLDPRPLDPSPDSPVCKFVIFTPLGHEQQVIEAIHRGGGGRIGLYTHCTFRLVGTGTFKGSAESNPFIGKAGEFEEATEFRIEALVPKESRSRVLSEVLKVHPYEEPAYEFYLLAGGAVMAGAGCIAKPESPMDGNGLVRQIKKGLKLASVRISGPWSKTASRAIRKVAICSGSGGSFIAKAAASGADAYITGEINYHSGIEAYQRGLTVIEVGHYESEQIIAEPLAQSLAADEKLMGHGIEFFAAKDDLNPCVRA